MPASDAPLWVLPPLASPSLLASATLLSSAPTAGAATVPPQIPQFAAAQSAAKWIVGQQAADGSIGGSLSTTANGILALAAAQVDPPAAQAALTYMEANANAYINSPSTDNADGPGQLANLILDAHAMGVDPTNFGGTNLVARLLRTEQTSGPDAGLFGTEQQLTDYDAGTFIQGLVFSALKTVGQTADAAAIGWLTGQQCPNGGWALPNQAIGGGCTEDPASFTGPDNQTTSVALQGLAAQGALTASIKASALSLFTTGQDADGGWSTYSNTVAQPQQADSQSTGLVIQALLALGLSPTSSAFTSSGHSPVSALLSFVVTSGSGRGRARLPGQHLGQPPRHQSGRSRSRRPDLRVRTDELLLDRDGHGLGPPIRFGPDLRIARRHHAQQAHRGHGRDLERARLLARGI